MINEIEFFNFIKDIFEMDRDIKSTKININEIENWDSLKHMQLIVGIEEKYEITFSGDEIADISSIEDLINKISKKNIK